MKRVFAFLVICLIALMSVSANVGTGFELVSSDRSFEQPFDNAAQLKVWAVSSQTELITCPCPVCQKTTVNGYKIFINPSGVCYGGSLTDERLSLISVNDFF